VSASYSPVATSILNVSDIFLDGNRTLYLQDQQLYGLGVNGEFFPYLYELGGLKKIQKPYNDIFYGLMTSEDFMIYNPDLKTEEFFNNHAPETVR